MSRYIKLVVAASAVAMALVASVGVASANRGISVSETRISGTSRLIVFRGTSGFELSVTCFSATSSGISERTIAKVEGTRAGAITEFGAGLCRSNFNEPVTMMAQNLPWPGYYVAYLGTLPGITGLEGRSTVRFRLNFNLGISCVYEGSVYGLSPVSRGVISSGRILTELTTLTKVEGSSLCPGTATVEGEAMTTTPVTVTLI